MRTKVLLLCTAIGLVACSPHKTSQTPVIEKSYTDIAASIAAGHESAESVARASLARIKDLEPKLHAVIAVNKSAPDAARAADVRRTSGKPLGPLDGMPILIKDNVDVAGMATTAGSLALQDNIATRDAPLVKRLRDAGAVIVAKTNLSEWANFRSGSSLSGWSGMGGLVRNPYALDRSACGSSAGSGASVAASYAPAAIGTETNGSIVCPASVNGLVGLKPTVGLVSRTGVIPISHTQDTAGPMTRNVTDAAAVLTVIAGSDPADPATAEADDHKTDYVKGLDPTAIKTARLGAIRFMHEFSEHTQAVYNHAIDALRAQGVVIVDITDFDAKPVEDNYLTVLLTEFKVDLNAYLATSNPKVKARTLADLISFNQDEPRELAWFGQDIFVRAQATNGYDDPVYIAARDTARQHAGPLGIDKLLADNNVVALLAPTNDPAWVIDTVSGDRDSASSSTIPAAAGYPHLTVPMGNVQGMPVGLSFIGPAWSEQMLLSLGLGFEQMTKARRAPTYAASVKTP